MQIRLQKFLSQAGIASRRASEKLILQGRVTINGEPVKKLGVKINPLEDAIRVDGKLCRAKKSSIYIAINKPKGFITTVSDPFGRPTVLDLLHDINERIFPVGRLDKDTEGLLLLTNDGQASYKLTHPKYQVYKTYIAKVKGAVTSKNINVLEKGIKLGDGITAPAKAKIIKRNEKSTVIKITICEGKKRQVRRMFEAIGHPVIDLKRIRIGEISLNGLKPGKWRYLNKEELEYIRKL